MKFLHAADLHLDSPLRGLDRYEGAPVDAFRGATRRALTSLVDLALAEPVDFVLLVGDLYDGNWRDYRTGLFFVSEMARLRAADIPVFVVRGNHDAESHITRHVRLPDNVRELSTSAPETDRTTLAHLGVAVHGQGFAERAIVDDLAASYPPALSGLFNVGLLHTCLSGRPGHDPYAPTTVETLARKGYDYWALGHVHEREVLSEAPWIVFPGNLQGRKVREAGPKGATLVTVERGRVARAEARALDAVRWADLRVGADGVRTGEEAIDHVRAALVAATGRSEGRTLAARVTLVGETAAHVALVGDAAKWTSEVRAVAADVSQATDGVWIERVDVATRTPIDLRALGERDDALGELVRGLAALERGDDAEAEAELAALTRVLVEESGLVGRLPGELREGDDALVDAAGRPVDLAGLVRDVEQLLIPRLVEREERLATAGRTSSAGGPAGASPSSGRGQGGHRGPGHDGREGAS